MTITDEIVRLKNRLDELENDPGLSELKELTEAKSEYDEAYKRFNKLKQAYSDKCAMHTKANHEEQRVLYIELRSLIENLGATL